MWPKSDKLLPNLVCTTVFVSPCCLVTSCSKPTEKTCTTMFLAPVFLVGKRFADKPYLFHRVASSYFCWGRLTPCLNTTTAPKAFAFLRPSFPTRSTSTPGSCSHRETFKNYFSSVGSTSVTRRYGSGVMKFGPDLAEVLRYRKPRRGQRWQLDERRVVIGGTVHWL